jgi:hypothetical protein
LLVRSLEDRIVPTAYLVTATSDTGIGSGTSGDLRYCLNKSSLGGSNTITFDTAGVFAGPQTISLTNTLTVPANTTLTGDGSAMLGIDGKSSFRVFNVTGTNVTISALTIQHGKSGSYGAGVQFSAGASTTINDCVITGNTGTSQGGALGLPFATNATSITLNRDVISNNTAVQGAGLYIYEDGTVVISNCSFTGNTTTSNSGAIYLYGGVTTISNSTFSGNKSGGTGGAIDDRFSDVLTVINSTIANNSSTSSGGGISLIVGFMSGSLKVYNSTIASNTAGSAGGGIAGTVALLSSSIVANNKDNGTGPDVKGTISTANQSLLGTSKGAVITTNNGTLINQDPLLVPLANNGGLTQTMLTGNGSPAHDAGNNVLGLSTDQRGPGFPRVQEAAPDIGATEKLDPAPSASATSPDVTAPGGASQTVTVVYTDRAESQLIDRSTIHTGNITVNGPNGLSATPSLVSADSAVDAMTITATYSFTAPDNALAGTWDGSDNGTYTVVSATTAVNEVLDKDMPTAQAVAPGTVIGSFKAAMTRNLTVNATTDVNAGSLNAGDFRYCLTQTNSDGVADTINFDPNVFNMPQMILVASALPVTNDLVTINGPGASNALVDGGGQYRIFDLTGAAFGGGITISGLNFQNGPGAVFGAEILLGKANTTINDCEVTGTKGIALGLGSAPNTTSITLNRDVIFNNGAGISMNNGGTLIINNCSFTTNGGALQLHAGQTTISNSTLSGNVGGGAIDSRSNNVLTVINSTICNNSSSGGGGGIFIDSGSVNIYNSTIASNTAGGTGGGIDIAPGAHVALSSTIVANNTDNGTAPDVNGLIGTANQSLLSTSTGAAIIANNGTFLNVDPLLSPLANNGGLTATMLIGSGSPARDSGNNALALLSDQRGVGFNRTIGGGTDIGAIELPLSVAPSASGKSANVPMSGGTTQIVTVVYSDSVGSQLIDRSTIGNPGEGELTVTGPNGFSVTPSFISADSAVDAMTITATHSFTAPDDAYAGTWDSSDNGIYRINMVAGKVFDKDSPVAFSVPAGVIGTFKATMPRVLTVNASTDTGTGSGNAGDFRYCLMQANGDVRVADTINFDPIAFNSPQTIMLTSTLVIINNAVTINGPGASKAMVDGGGQFRVLDLSQAVFGGSITISGLAIQNGKGIYSTASGAGILLGQANTSINDCAIIGNTCTSGGGGLDLGLASNSTTVTLNHDTITNNTAGSEGGALSLLSAGTMIINNCSITGNSSAYAGGALYLVGGVTTITGSSFSGNKAGGAGGAIYNWSDSLLTIINSTVANNSGGSGGGILNLGTANIYNSTISGNTATSGSGGGVAGYVTLLSSTIVANNLDNGTGPDVSGTINASNQSLLSNNTGAAITTNNGTLLNVNPLLGPLANNGGPTQTMAIGNNSPAKDAGNNILALAADQRGGSFARVYGSAPDIGAFEVQPSAHIQAVQVNDGSPQRSRVTSLTVTFDQPVMLPANTSDAFQLKRQSDNAIVGLSWMVNGNSVTLTFTGGPLDFGSLADGRYTLTAFAAFINGGNFDGNADGAPGDDYVLVGGPGTAPNLFRLYGDVNGDGTVSASDFIAFRQNFGGYLFAFDFDGDGAVAASDFVQFRLRFGGSI